MEKSILVIGAATSHIGRVTVSQKLRPGYNVVAIDNPQNNYDSGFPIKRFQELALEYDPNFAFYKMDLRDKARLEALFASRKFDAVVYFSRLEAAGEIVQKPLEYHGNNYAIIILLEVMDAYRCKRLVFSTGTVYELFEAVPFSAANPCGQSKFECSSSSTVYGGPEAVPWTEKLPLSAENVYGRNKFLIGEQMFGDFCRSDSEWKIIWLRYSSPVVADPSDYIDEDRHGIPNNLMPFVQQVAVGKRPAVTVCGTDCSRKDGFGVHDYAVYLANEHIATLNKLSDPSVGFEVYNLGTAKGTPVMQKEEAMEKAYGKGVLAPRRLNFQENQFPLVIATARKAAVSTSYNRVGKQSMVVYENDLRVGAPPVQRKAKNGSFTVKGVLAERRPNFQEKQFPLATETASKAAVAPICNRAFKRSRVVNVNDLGIGAPFAPRKATNESFTVKAQLQVNLRPKQKPQTLDSRFANMKKQRMMAFSEQNSGGRREGRGQQGQQSGRG